MIFEVYPRIAPFSPSTMLVDSPSPISRLSDQFQRENLGAHGSPDMPGKYNQSAGGKLSAPTIRCPREDLVC